MPEWYLVIIAFAVLSALGSLWTPLSLALPVLALAVSVPLVQGVLSATRASFTSPPRSRVARLKLRTLTAFLHMLQPLARLCGRLRYRLTPWRRGAPGLSLPRPRTSALWTEQWQDPTVRLHSLETALRVSEASVLRGGDYDRWDLEVQGGLLGAARILMAVEDHGAGSQFVRFHSWPLCSPGAVTLTFLLGALSTGAVIDHAWTASAILGTGAAFLALRTLQECAGATTAILRVLKQAETGEA